MNSLKIKLFTIPNCITLLNLLAGCLATIYAIHGNLLIASILIFIAGIFDFLDGMAARLLHSYSELGKQLDSLADVVSFGIAPSSILFYLFVLTIQKTNSEFSFNEANFQQILLLTSSFIIALFSALRLAKFNIDPRQSDSFIGVPTPAIGFLIASLPFIIYQYPVSSNYILSVYTLLPLVIICSFLLVSEIPLLSLKFKNLHFADNKFRYVLIILSLILLGFFQISSFPIIFIIYLALSVIGK
jgi:CDP-diacylglycerol--serine O-phosphatidyltransferase